MHHVWCLDPKNTKDFFERIQDYQAKIYPVASDWPFGKLSSESSSVTLQDMEPDLGSLTVPEVST